MKKIFNILLAVLIAPTCLWGQANFVPKTDGTKYYILIYDGVKNDKIVDLRSSAAWNENVTFSDFFSGVSSQLFRFYPAANHPGYYIVNNTSLKEKSYLMSWSWNAYFEEQVGGKEGNETRDPEFWYTFKHGFDGWQRFETFEKPKGNNGIDYTPGADAFMFDAAKKAANFKVKSADITSENGAFKAYKFVEFDPVQLFHETIVRGRTVYTNNANINANARLNLLTELEKAAAVRVFGADGEFVKAQARIDSVLKNFNTLVELNASVTDAKTFIDASTASAEVKTSFNALIARAEAALNAANVNYQTVSAYKSDLASAKDLVNSIIAGTGYVSNIPGTADARLKTGVQVGITSGKNALANEQGNAALYNGSISLIGKDTVLCNEIQIAQALVAKTVEFDEAKAALNANIETAIGVLTNTASTATDIDNAIKKLQKDIVAFNAALEAGDTMVKIKNPDFTTDFSNWSSITTNGAIYRSGQGVDASQALTLWSGGAYQSITTQSIKGLPKGKYVITVMANVSSDNDIAFFAINGVDSVKLPLTTDGGGLKKRTIQIEVVNDSIKFGIKGNTSDNGIPAGQWAVIDNFEVKWLSKTSIQNPSFDSNNLNSWTNASTPAGAVYPSAQGVDNSPAMTIWSGSAYNLKVTQNLNLANGLYQISAKATLSSDNHIALFAYNGTDSAKLPLTADGGAKMVKRKIQIKVINGMLEFGIKGAGSENGVPSGQWGVFDDFEVVRLPDVEVVNANFSDNLTGWTIAGTTGTAYIENKGVDGSKSVTYWSGSDYNISTSQILSGLSKGEYELSAMAMISDAASASFKLFATSGTEDKDVLMPHLGWVLSKYKVTGVVTDGTLTIGVKGSGTSNAVPANHWIVFDNFEIKMKSIVPEYGSTVWNTPAIVIEEDQPVEPSSQAKKHSIEYRMIKNVQEVIANENIVTINVYNILGIKLTELKPNNTSAGISLEKGLYILQVSTQSGITDVKKIVVQ